MSTEQIIGFGFLGLLIVMAVMTVVWGIYLLINDRKKDGKK